MFKLPYPFIFMPQSKDQQSHFLLLAYFTFVTTTFRFRYFWILQFFILLESQGVNLRKIWPNGRSPIGNFQIIIWDFSNRELRKHIFINLTRWPHYYYGKLFHVTFLNFFLRVFYYIRLFLFIYISPMHTNAACRKKRCCKLVISYA